MPSYQGSWQCQSTHLYLEASNLSVNLFQRAFLTPEGSPEHRRLYRLALRASKRAARRYQACL